VKEDRITFNSGRLRLEGILSIPDGEGPFPAVVVCHPHPLYGGDMYNNVVSVVSVALVQASIVALRFNFRGVGSSQGEYGGGIGEQEDVEAAISYLAMLDDVDTGRIGFAGYSVGAGFGITVACSDKRVKALAAISPPLSMFDFECLKGCAKPKILVCGERDDFTPSARFVEFCQSLADPKEFATIAGVDHFWWGHESEVADRVAGFFVEAL
jgi:alpha/beta superfamily hydrolase